MGKKEEAKGTPKGHFVVYVGKEMARFVVPMAYLKSPIFQKLLEKAADEYGYDHPNGIVLPCNASSFLRLVHVLDKTLAMAPFVDRGLLWFTLKFKF
ncbi:auxin-induced protein x15 [Senna tora]|uniref:Auxin-induced protein x15 n=1 Tax=Senna tora TaxID=362788 RepID=A0A834SX05_9FABA|nr:auxin-induced protein x15 [Senna tora]